ncbi:HAD hydrolase-like protein [Kamptonema cortianum]|nr:HAD hydrolase-like protein [Kamptonema cortianum]
MQFKNIIFDWSGTLVDDLGPVLDATNQIFNHYGKPAWSREEFREKFFLPFPKFYTRYLPEATMVELEHHYHRSFKCLEDNVAILPHAREFLDFCRERKYRLFLLSTIHAEHFAIQAKRLGIQDYFEHPYVQIIDKKLKISQIIADHGLNPRETMFVGDMQHDIDTAHHGGVTAVAVLTGYDSEEKLKKSNPDLMFGNLLSLREYLSRHTHLPDYFPIATVGALIFNAKNEALMIQTHKWSHKWGIPGGENQNQ